MLLICRADIVACSFMKCSPEQVLVFLCCGLGGGAAPGQDTGLSVIVGQSRLWLCILQSGLGRARKGFETLASLQ